MQTIIATYFLQIAVILAAPQYYTYDDEDYGCSSIFGCDARSEHEGFDYDDYYGEEEYITEQLVEVFDDNGNKICEFVDNTDINLAGLSDAELTEMCFDREQTNGDNTANDNTADKISGIVGSFFGHGATNDPINTDMTQQSCTNDYNENYEFSRDINDIDTSILQNAKRISKDLEERWQKQVDQTTVADEMEQAVKALNEYMKTILDLESTYGDDFSSSSAHAR